MPASVIPVSHVGLSHVHKDIEGSVLPVRSSKTHLFITTSRQSSSMSGGICSAVSVFGGMRPAILIPSLVTGVR